MSRPESCNEPAGVSPVRVSAGAPGSRPQPESESTRVKAGRQEPHRREQERGPQHQVNPAVSSDSQWESRAEHVAAKAMPAARSSGPTSAAGLSGIRGTARAQGSWRNRRDPSAQPPSGQGRAYKPKVKARGAQRESEGVVVPVTGASHNASRGKGPCFGHACEGGKREGMTGTARSDHPGGLPPIDKVRRLQRKLWAAAKRHPGRRFHALYDRIHRSDVLWEAWKRVRRNRGAAGVDTITLAAVEEYGVARLLDELRHDLQTGRYRPQPALRRYIPKADGRQRPLGIPTVRDRVAQMAAKLVLEPVFEADFTSSSYGFRPRRSATQALETIRETANRGYNHVLDADIRDFFGSLDHQLLMERVARRVSDRRVLKLLRNWLRAGVMDEGRYAEMVSGTPQGGVISPLLSNIYLHSLDTVWERRCTGLGVLVRYADDFVVLCRTTRDAEEAERRMRLILARLPLGLHPEKTRRVNLSHGKEGFDFLGCHLHKRVSGLMLERGKRCYFLHRWPSTRSMKRVRQRVKELTDRRWNGVRDVRVLIRHLNPVLRGWGEYFRTGNASIKFQDVDRHVERRLRRFLIRRAGRNLHAGRVAGWTPEWLRVQGLYRLFGTIRYPGAA